MAWETIPYHNLAPFQTRQYNEQLRKKQIFGNSKQSYWEENSYLPTRLWKNVIGRIRNQNEYLIKTYHSQLSLQNECISPNEVVTSTIPQKRTRMVRLFFLPSLYYDYLQVTHLLYYVFPLHKNCTNFLSIERSHQSDWN